MIRLETVSYTQLDVYKRQEEINVFVENADAQVVKGNKAAGARARKAALDLMKDLKEFSKVSEMCIRDRS